MTMTPDPKDAVIDFRRGYLCADAYIASTERNDRMVRDMLSPLGINTLAELLTCGAEPYDIELCKIAFTPPQN